jgi:hypothetical protein
MIVRYEFIMNEFKLLDEEMDTDGGEMRSLAGESDNFSGDIDGYCLELMQLAGWADS